MGCQDILPLLGTGWRENRESTRHVADHIRACLLCQAGLGQLAQVLVTGDVLSCEQCRALLPAYYEVMQPVYLLARLSGVEVADVAFHLDRCAACRELYAVLCQLSALEEGG